MFKNPALICLFYKVLAVLPHRGIIIVEYTKFQKCGKKWKSEYFQGVRSFCRGIKFDRIAKVGRGYVYFSRYI